MRILAGKYKSKKIQTINNSNTRPMMSKVREAIFNSLQFLIEDKEVLDLYAGSGSLGIEAISRGAKFVTFVEKSKECIDVLNKNLKELDINFIITNTAVETFIKSSINTYDIVFYDPPFEMGSDKVENEINNLENFEISENETCRFLSSHSRMNERASIVDIDPFGSPSKYIDCAIRATMHSGMLALTATDLQVLHGLFNKAAKRRYYGTPVKTEFSNEIAIRLILGCVSFVAGRLDISFQPLFVDHDMHYYRTYMKILNTPEKEEKIGYIIFCRSCKDRYTEITRQDKCRKCGHETEIAGPLWIGKLFEKEFIQKMKNVKNDLIVNKKCDRIIERAEEEAELPATYYTLDEIASMIKSAPLKLNEAIERLRAQGYKASMTSLNPGGFRTDCEIDKITQIFQN